ncbi:MAG: tetratricopeptide repeat protein, partial [Actinomycetota bacterium]
RFEITSLNQDTIASICSAVDGIPLAIEVAAARARALTPDQILALLEHPLSALAERSSSSSRHPTVKAALDWSYDLLERDLQIVLDRLSVFPAEFDVDGMEAVACRPPVEASPIDAITELVDASVVFVMGKESGVARYRLPVIIRDYGSLHLKDSSNEVDVGNAHARYVFDVILRAGDTISSPGFADWIPILVALTPDIRTALDWSLSRWTRAESLVVARTLMHFWYRTGNPVDAIKWGRRMLDDISGVPNHLVAAARNCVGFGANVLGDADEALFQMDGAVALLRDGDHPRLLINALWGRGHVALQVGDVSTAHRCATEALALGDEIGDPWLRADPLSLLGFALFFSGQSLHDARRYSEEAQALYRELGDTASQSVMNPLSAIAVRQGDFASAERYALDVAALAVGTGWEGAALVNLADVFYEQGRIDEATTTLERGVLRSLDAGLENWFRIALRDLARIAVRRRDGRRAALLIGASRRNMPVYGLDPTIHEPIDAFCRSVLGDGEFTLATAEGRDMGYERLMELAIAGSHARVDAT